MQFNYSFDINTTLQNTTITEEVQKLYIEEAKQMFEIERRIMLLILFCFWIFFIFQQIRSKKLKKRGIKP